MQHHRIFKSKVFLKLFLSYVTIICVFVIVYAVLFVRFYKTDYETNIRQQCTQEVSSWAIEMDRQLLSAQNMCNSLNTSESCRLILQSGYVENKTIDSMQLYRVLNEIRHIKGSGNSMHIYSLLLGFQNDEKLFSSGIVIPVEGNVQAMTVRPFLGVTSISAFLGVKSTNIIINKQYLIYAENYTALNTTGNAKGIILVLFDVGSVEAMIQEFQGLSEGSDLSMDGKTVFSLGEKEGVAFSVTSIVNSNIVYTMYVPESKLVPVFQIVGFLPLIIIVFAGVVFILITYRISRLYYQPIDSINRLIDPSEENGQRPRNEMEGILDGIRELIGERNGYREKMLTITPYVRQGMLHSLISGRNTTNDFPIQDQFMELRRNYFILGILNIAEAAPKKTATLEKQYQDMQEIIIHSCREFSNDDLSVVCFTRDLQNMFLVINFDTMIDKDQLFYQLYQRITDEIDNPDFMLTIGVGTVKTDLGQLSSGAEEAEQALAEMLSGGRGSVYYFEQEGQNKEHYFFPKVAERHFSQAFISHDYEKIDQFLNDLYQQNIQNRELPPAEIRMMIDELHYSLLNALRDAYDLTTTHIQIERIHEPATIDEVFSYYRSVIRMAIDSCGTIAQQEDAEKLEQEVCSWIDQNIYSPDLSLNALCDKFGISGKMVGVICRKRYGMTFLQYVRNQQIQHAAELLRETDKSLEEIAHLCGFSNVLTFRRNFKSVMNTNPSDFRQ